MSKKVSDALGDRGSNNFGDLIIVSSHKFAQTDKLSFRQFPFHVVDGLVDPLDVTGDVPLGRINSVKRGVAALKIKRILTQIQFDARQSAFEVLSFENFIGLIFREIKWDITFCSISAKVAKSDIDRMFFGTPPPRARIATEGRSSFQVSCCDSLLYPTLTLTQPLTVRLIWIFWGLLQDNPFAKNLPRKIGHSFLPYTLLASTVFSCPNQIVARNGSSFSASAFAQPNSMPTSANSTWAKRDPITKGQTRNIVFCIHTNEYGSWVSL